jgi:hypothetical protein
MFESFSAELIPKELEMDAKNVDCDIWKKLYSSCLSVKYAVQ